MLRRCLLVLLGFPLSACVDRGLTVYNTEPEVVITSPAPGTILVAEQPLVLSASVTDAQDPNTALTYSWSSTLAGTLIGKLDVSDTSVSLAVDSLPQGEQTISLVVVDHAGSAGDSEVAVSVVNNSAPNVTFAAPLSGQNILEGQPFDVSVAVSDDYTNPEGIHLQWSGLDDLSAAPSTPDTEGNASFTIAFAPEGEATLYVSATDSMGATSAAFVEFTIFIDDDDDDGYTDAASGGGDCDDRDPLVNPGAFEDCDAMDNDCSGTIDDDGACDCVALSRGDESYLFCREDRSWLDARDICAGLGFELVKLDDAAEDEWVSSGTLTTDDSAVWWIGLSDLATEGDWVWVDGTPATYTNWMWAPDGGVSESCAEYHISQAGQWNDLACSGDTAGYDTYFVCELN